MRNKNSGHFQAFTEQWFADHQDILIFLLNAPIVKRWFRYCMRLRAHDILPEKRISYIGPNRFSYDDKIQYDWETGRLQRMVTIDFRSHNKFSKRMYFAFRPLWWAMHAWDSAFADWAAPRLSFGFSTLTINPDPGNPGTTTVDGYMSRNNVSTWVDAISGNGDQSNGTDTSEAYIVIYRGSGGGDNSNRRTRFGFDTSVVGGGGTIYSGVLSLYGVGKQDSGGVSPNINVYGGNSYGSNTTMANADYQNTGSTAYSTAIAYSSWNTSAYNAFTLNGTAVSAINKTGVTNIAARNANYDVASATPGSTNTVSYVQGYFADQTGTSNDPKLVLTVLDASKSVSDTGTGTDTKAITATFTRSDTGTGVDSKGILAAIARSDTGTGIDTKAILAALTRSDAGTGTDSVTPPTAGVGQHDTCTGSDVAGILAKLTRSDTGTGADAVNTLLAAIAIAEVGSGSDSLAQITVMVGLQETAGSSEALQIFFGVNTSITVSDSGTSQDTFTIIAKLSIQDTGAGVDTVQSPAIVNLSESGIGADTMGLLAKIAHSDSGSAMEALAVAVMLGLQDHGNAADFIQIMNSSTLHETATAADILSVSGLIMKMLSDSGQATDEVRQVFNSFTLTEHPTASDLVTLFNRIYPYTKKKSPYIKIKPE